MMGWIMSALASGPARKALGLFLAIAILALFLLNLRRAGERMGRLAERRKRCARPTFPVSP
jgi:hypothetical protein